MEAGSNVALPSNKNPNFIRDYFSSSRLHFIGSFRARYESMLLAISRKLNLPAHRLLNPPPPPLASPVIAHIDIDCFFASIAIKLNPSLAGKCIAVCHGGGEISSCSYEAREYGIRAGMFFKDAKKKCTALISVPYEFEQYEEASVNMYAIMFRRGVCVEAVSVDEAYVDLTGVEEVESWVTEVREEIFRVTGCTASAGIGPSKIVARLATKKAKPNGQMRLGEGDVEKVLHEMSVGELPGIGWRTERKLQDMGVETCGGLRQMSLERLKENFGERQGKVFYDMVRGWDGRKVEPLKPRKSVGAEVSWGVRFEEGEGEKVKKFVEGLVEEVERRLQGGKGKKVVLKVYRKKEGSMAWYKHLGHGPCHILTKSLKWGGIGLKDVVWRVYKGMGVQNGELRGVGVQVTEIEWGGLGVDYTKRKGGIEAFFGKEAVAHVDDVDENVDEEQMVVEDEGEGGEEVDIVHDDEIQVERRGEDLHFSDSNGASKSEVNKKVYEIEEDRIEPGRAESPKRINNQANVEDQLCIPSGWDADVFRALPEEIQRELLQDNEQANRENGNVSRAIQREREAAPVARRKRRAGANMRLQEVVEKKRKQTEQVTMTQFADISELRTHGHRVLDATEFRERPLRDCVELLRDLKGEKLRPDQWEKKDEERDVEEDVLDIPSPPSLSSDSSQSEEEIEKCVMNVECSQIYEEEEIVDSAHRLQAWMMITEQDVKSAHVELLRGRLLELVGLKRIQKLCCELRLIRRYAKQLETDGWKEGFNTVLMDVQNEMVKLHGVKVAIDALEEFE